MLDKNVVHRIQLSLRLMADIRPNIPLPQLSHIKRATPLTVNGTTTAVEDGRTVTVTLNNQTYTTTVTGNAWSVNVDLVGQRDDGWVNPDSAR